MQLVELIGLFVVESVSLVAQLQMKLENGRDVVADRFVFIGDAQLATTFVDHSVRQIGREQVGQERHHLVLHRVEHLLAVEELLHQRLVGHFLRSEFREPTHHFRASLGHPQHFDPRLFDRNHGRFEHADVKACQMRLFLMIFLRNDVHEQFSQQSGEWEEEHGVCHVETSVRRGNHNCGACYVDIFWIDPQQAVYKLDILRKNRCDPGDTQHVK